MFKCVHIYRSKIAPIFLKAGSNSLAKIHKAGQKSQMQKRHLTKSNIPFEGSGETRD